MFPNQSLHSNNKTICDDKVFAHLTDVFGEQIPAEIILRTGRETNWQSKRATQFFLAFMLNFNIFKILNSSSVAWVLFTFHNK